MPNDIGRGLEHAKAVHHVDDRRRTPPVLYVVEDAARLEVRDDHLLGVLRVHEAAIELRDRQELLLRHRHDDVGRQAVGPLGLALPLFVHRDALGEPARRAMVRHFEHEHVVRLVPQRARPVERSRLASRRTVHRDHRAKRDAERAKARHPERPHREVLVIRIDLDLHRFLQRRRVLLPVGREGRLEQRLDIRPQHIGFLHVQLDDRRRVLDRDEILGAVEEPQAVHGRRVAVAVVVAELEFPLRLVHLAEPHQIDRHRGASRPQPRVEIDRLAVVRHAVLVTAIDHELRRDDRVALSIARIDVQEALDPAIRRTVRQDFHGRVNRHRVERFVR